MVPCGASLQKVHSLFSLLNFFWNIWLFTSWSLGSLATAHGLGTVSLKSLHSTQKLLTDTHSLKAGWIMRRKMRAAQADSKEWRQLKTAQRTNTAEKSRAWTKERLAVQSNQHSPKLRQTPLPYASGFGKSSFKAMGPGWQGATLLQVTTATHPSGWWQRRGPSRRMVVWPRHLPCSILGWPATCPCCSSCLCWREGQTWVGWAPKFKGRLPFNHDPS